MKTRLSASPADQSPRMPADDLVELPISPLAHALWTPLAMTAASCKEGEAIAEALAILGPYYRADRGWVGRYNSALTHFWGVNDWVRGNVVSHLHEIQGVPVDMMLDAHQKFLRSEIVAIPDVDRLPRQSRSLQAELRREGIKSTLCGPLERDGNLIGFFGFDYVREPAGWTPAELQLLGPVATYLAALLSRTLAPEIPAEPSEMPQGVVYISDRSGQLALPIDSIAFIEADGDYSRVHLIDGRYHLELRSLRTWLTQLPRERFLRVHQSYLVNASLIERLGRGQRWELSLKEVPSAIPVGRAFRHEVRMHMGF